MLAGLGPLASASATTSSQEDVLKGRHHVKEHGPGRVEVRFAGDHGVQKLCVVNSVGVQPFPSWRHAMEQPVMDDDAEVREAKMFHRLCQVGLE